jgi:hypothetical protein
MFSGKCRLHDLGFVSLLEHCGMDMNVNGYDGKTMIDDLRNQTEAEMVIHQERLSLGYKILTGYVITKEGKEKVVGELTYTKISKNIRPDGQYGCQEFATNEDSYTFYGPLNGDKSTRVYVAQITSSWRENFKEVGTKLIQAVFEIALKDKKGSKQLQLNAVRAIEIKN